MGREIYSRGHKRKVFVLSSTKKSDADRTAACHVIIFRRSRVLLGGRDVDFRRTQTSGHMFYNCRGADWRLCQFQLPNIRACQRED